MRISARVSNRLGSHSVWLETDGVRRSLDVPPKPSGLGSDANGGELLCLALTTCYCNDIYREAASRGIAVKGVEVEAWAEFGAPGEPASSLRYRAHVQAEANEHEVRELMLHTDRVAEIQNTLRKGIAVHFDIGRALSEDADAVID